MSNARRNHCGFSSRASQSFIDKSFGWSAADVIEIDKRCHSEVFDPKHRYAKNLRFYFKEWEKSHNFLEGNIWENFFDWLDSEISPNLSICPRESLEEDTVLYLNSEIERLPYLLYIREGLIYESRLHRPLGTGEEGWIVVMQEDRLYGNPKITTSFPRFHHSSFFAGEPVQFAGLIVADEGRLRKLFPHSGHYRPTEHHLFHMLFWLEERLPAPAFAAVEVDVQRVTKMAREQTADGAKVRKKLRALFWTAPYSLAFLRAKHEAWLAGGLFAELHRAVLARGIRDEDELSSVSSRDSLDPPGPGHGGESLGTAAERKLASHHHQHHQHRQWVSPYL